jgi:hypothetical protein
MKKIMTYSVFENSKGEFSGEDKIKYFEKILKETPEGKDFSRWFDIKSVKTGRFYITKKKEIEGISIPSKSYFNHSEYSTSDSEKWYYEFSSSGGSYGTTSGNLRELFRKFMIDAVRKSRPSSISQKRIEEFFSKESNAPMGNFPSPKSVYDKILNESGLIQDFGFLSDLDFVKKCKEVGIECGKRSTSFYVLLHANKIVEKILGKEKMNSLIDLAIELDKIKPLYFKFLNPQESDFILTPKSDKGKSLSKGRYETTLKIGTEDKDLIIKSLEDYVRKYLDHRFSLGGKFSHKGSIYIEKINKYLISQVFGEGSITKEEIEEDIEKFILDYVGDYFKENPLELYLLDEFPDMKKKIIEKYGISDFSKLGKNLNKGWL